MKFGDSLGKRACQRGACPVQVRGDRGLQNIAHPLAAAKKIWVSQCFRGEIRPCHWRNRPRKAEATKRQQPVDNLVDTYAA